MKVTHCVFTLVVAGGLSTGMWAQHGGGAHGGPEGHGGPDFATGAGSHGPSSGTTHGSQAGNFEARLAGNTALSSRLQPLLPPNTTLQAAASGFKNQGQFIAALHVSHNLNIPFDQLKADMTGTGHDSLGQAVHALRPDLDSKTVSADVKIAEHQAKTDVQESTETAEAREN